MGSTSIDEDLVEEREELMVSYNNENNIQKAIFLKPCVSSIEGMLRPSSSPELKASSLDAFFRGWKIPDASFKFWAKKMEALHRPIWLKAGIFEAIEASTYKINKNSSLILSLAQNWCLETNTFVFPWGEATITLEDVNVILGFSLSGLSVLAAALESSEMGEAIEKLEKQIKDNTKRVSWMLSFDDDEMEHEAFLTLWLSKYVFPDSSGVLISKHVIPIAIRLARGERIALAPAVLAILYSDLGKIQPLDFKVYLKSSLFKLVQVWIWERFKNIRPVPKEIRNGEPRIAQWSGVKQRFENGGMILFDGNFDWRPYTQPLMNWNPPKFYLEDAKWLRINESLDDEFVLFARFVRVSNLVGIGVVENYNPNRVARQFGFAQDLTDLVSSKVTKQEAWDDYNRSLVGLKLYVPSRFETGLVTVRYQDWWTKSVSDMQKRSNETFNLSNTVAFGTVVIKVLPLSQVHQKLDDGMKKGEHSMNMRAHEDDENDETDDDDNMTIAEKIRSRKKFSDVENVSDLPQELAFGYETVARQGTEQKNDENNTPNPSDGAAEQDNNVSELPQKIAFGDETVARKETEKKKDENNTSNPFNGVAEQEDDDDDERWKQGKLRIREMELKMEARISKVESTLAMIKEWKLGKN